MGLQTIKYSLGGKYLDHLHQYMGKDDNSSVSGYIFAAFNAYFQKRYRAGLRFEDCAVSDFGISTKTRQNGEQYTSYDLELEFQGNTQKKIGRLVAEKGGSYCLLWDVLNAYAVSIDRRPSRKETAGMLARFMPQSATLN